MKTALHILVSVLVAGAAAIAGPEADNAKKQAQRCADATIKKDYDTLISLTHSNIIKAAGGKEAMRKALEAGMKLVAEQGIVFEKTEIKSAAEPKKVGKALVSLVGQEVTLRTPDGKQRHESTLVAYSYDDGKNWVFADTAEMDEAAFYKYFPELKGVIALPPKKESVAVK
jgi:hypothetical protein